MLDLLLLSFFIYYKYEVKDYNYSTQASSKLSANFQNEMPKYGDRMPAINIKVTDYKSSAKSFSEFKNKTIVLIFFYPEIQYHRLMVNNLLRFMRKYSIPLILVSEGKMLSSDNFLKYSYTNIYLFLDKGHNLLRMFSIHSSNGAIIVKGLDNKIKFSYPTLMNSNYLNQLVVKLSNHQL